MRNIRNFAEKPEWLDARFDPLMDLARTKRLTQEEITKYLQSMVSEREKRDISNAYYRRGLKDGETRGMEKGMEKGIEKGIEIKALETARTMIADGVPVQQIAKWTGLTEEQIQGGIETTSQR